MAVVNPTEAAQPLRLAFKGVTPSAQGRCWKMAAPNINARNDVGQAAQVQVVESPLTGRPDALSIEPISISLYEFRI